MTFRQKLLWGLLLTILGFIGIIFASSLGFTSFGRPWSFISGFVTGIIITVGVGMLISGLTDDKGK